MVLYLHNTRQVTARVQHKQLYEHGTTPLRK
jgi:hypothetical protein